MLRSLIDHKEINFAADYLCRSSFDSKETIYFALVIEQVNVMCDVIGET